jgi:hypothetical protein
MEDQHNSESIFNITLDQEAKSLLKTTTVWAKITAIVAFAHVGLSLVQAFIGKNSTAEMVGSIFGSMIGAVISILLNVFLYRFSQKTADAISSSNQQLFTEGINSLRTYFKIFGILIIVLLSLFVIFLFFMFLALGLAGTQ